MVTASSASFADVLRQLIENVVQAAESAPTDEIERFRHCLGEPTDQLADLPADVVRQLDELTRPPDWWTLLVFAMTRIRALDPEQFRLGSIRLPGWTRMLTLTYAPRDVPATFTIGLALLTEDDAALKRGLMLQTTGDVPLAFDSGPLSLRVRGEGNGRWLVEFGQPLRKPDVPAGALTVEATFDIAPLLTGVAPGAMYVDLAMAEARVGALALEATLSDRPDESLYQLTLGLGSGDAPGLGVRLKPIEALAGLPIDLSLPTIDFRPRAGIAADRPPWLDIGQREVENHP